MRRGLMELLVLIALVISFHAVRIFHSGLVEGHISPAITSPSVIAIKGNDSVIVKSNNGHFGLELQPGDWKLIFAVNEYNTAPFEKRVQVMKGQRIDLGEIRLSQ
jgi:hypothetical protein